MEARVYTLSRTNRLVFPVLLVLLIPVAIGIGMEQAELIRQGETDGVGLFVAVGSLLLAAHTCFGILAVRWRLRIDERGVAVRAFRTYDLWPWSDFVDGSVVRPEGSTTTLRHRNRPALFGRNLLSLRELSKADRQEVLQAIAARWCEPATGPLPTRLKLRYRDPLNRRSVTLDDFGVGVHRGRKHQQYGWESVTRVSIVRPERNRSDFRSLTIDLPDRSLRFGAPRSLGAFHGASTAALAAFICQRLDRERLFEFVAGEDPPDARHALVLRDHAARELRNGRAFFLTLQALSLAALATGFYVGRTVHPDKTLAAPLIGFVLGLFVLLPAHIGRWTMRRNIAGLNRLID